MSLTGVLLVAEQRNGEPRRMALELATRARQLADEGCGPVSAVVIGPGASAAAEKLGEYGVERAFVSEDKRCGSFPVVAEAAVVERAVQAVAPLIVLIAASNAGRDVAARLSARLGLGVIAAATDVRVAEGQPVVTCPVFGGSIVEEKGFVDGRGVVLMRPNAVSAEASPASIQTAIEFLDVVIETGHAAEIVETAAESSSSLPVEESSVVVAGGRGLGTAEGFELLRELARELDGAVGSTRPAVDAGWIDYATQIGLTGKIVKPKLYIALGVSGAVQHRIGMQTSEVIVAVNRNPDASIFQYSDFGVVGDLFEIVPRLIESIRKRKQG